MFRFVWTALWPLAIISRGFLDPNIDYRVAHGAKAVICVSYKCYTREHVSEIIEHIR